MRIRFQADADLNHIILAALTRRVPEVDFGSAAEAGLGGMADTAVLAQTAEEGRVLVSHDQRTMPSHFAEFIQTTSSSGVIIVPQALGVLQTVEELLLVWSASDAEEWINRIAYLPI